jgi:hypothetical protein
MENVLNLLLLNETTGDLLIREVVLPVQKAIAAMSTPQFICDLPRGFTVWILGTTWKKH